MLFQGNSIKNSTFKEPCEEGVFSFQTKSKLFLSQDGHFQFIFEQCAK
jgi:hypothetical protein